MGAAMNGRSRIGWVATGGLAAVIVPPVVALFSSMPIQWIKWAALAGTGVWFAAAPFWLADNREKSSGATS